MNTSLENKRSPVEIAAEILDSRNKGKAFQDSKDLTETIQLCVDFYEGRQWGTVKGKTKALPRATFNQTEMIVNNKVAGILATPLKVLYTSSDMPEKARKITDFHTAIEKEIDADAIYEDCVNKAAVEGCAFVHFYWDADAVGKRGEYKGGMRAELLEAASVTVHNPLEEKIQKQKWIIVESREEVAAVREMCEFPAYKDLIVSDDNDLLSGTDREQEGSNLVTVYTRYFRKEGEVYFEKATKATLIHRARALNPDLNLKSEFKDEEGEYGNTDLQDKPKRGEDNGYHASLYPIEVYQYKSRKNFIYGRGEVEPIISNNRTINFNAAMMSKSVEDQGFGTLVAKEGALGAGRTISNDPSKVLMDKYKGNGNGFYVLNKQPFNASAYQLNESIMNTTRTVTGATEVMSGEVLGKNQSGTSIAYLQQQAQKPIDKLAKRYRKFRERVARIELQYYVLYYEDKEYETEISVNELKEQALARMSSGDPAITPESIETIKEPERIKDLFKGDEFKDIEFDITVEVGATSQYSEISVVQMLESLLQAKYISLKSFYKIYPDNLLPNKQDLIDDLEEQDKSQLNQLSQQLQQAQEQIQKDLEVIKRQDEVVNNIMGTIQENRQLKAMLAQLQAEYAAKINFANKEILGERGAVQALAEILHTQGTAQKSDISQGNA